MSLPKYGTAQIKCAKNKCDWNGYETDMGKDKDGRCQCPKCGNQSYFFMTKKEIKKFNLIKDSK